MKEYVYDFVQVRPGRLNGVSVGSFQMDGQNVTDQTFKAASLSMKPRARFMVATTPSEPATTGRVIRINLFKRSAGWRWLDHDTSFFHSIISVEHGGKHYYCLHAEIETPVTLKHYPEKPSEPRLRPTTKGFLVFEEVIDSIVVRGRIHPLYHKIRITPDPQAETEAA